MADEKFYGYAGAGRPLHEAVQVQRLADVLVAANREFTQSPEFPHWARHLATAILDSDVIQDVKAEVHDLAVSMVCEMVGVPDVNWANPYRRAITRELEKP